jgi:hypothetical protein
MCHRTLLSLLAAILLSACAAAMPGYTPETKRKPMLPASDPGTMTAGGGYQLSETENKLDCKRLTGTMYIIIARLRDAKNRKPPSQIASVTQKTLTLVGGTDAGSTLEADIARERARLEAFNRRLAEKQCKTLDLEAELNPRAASGKQP